MNKKPRSREQVMSRRMPIRDVNLEHKEKLSRLEHFALWANDSIGSVGFFVFLLVWSVLWFGWNILAPEAYRFDNVPSFVVWLFISNLIQLFFLPLIIFGQNLQTKHAEARSEADLEIGLRSEKEIELILEHLEYQNDVMLKILGHIEQETSETE